MYFSSIPNIKYDFNDKTYIVKDIFRKAAFVMPVVSEAALTKYYIRDGETPDYIAYKFYNNSYYHWVILLTNNIINVNEEWPKPESRMFEYVEDKYGSGNATETHHYRIVNSNPAIIVDYDAADLSNGVIEAVSNYNYEMQLNEQKRFIKIIKPNLVTGFVRQYVDAMKS